MEMGTDQKPHADSHSGYRWMNILYMRIEADKDYLDIFQKLHHCSGFYLIYDVVCNNLPACKHLRPISGMTLQQVDCQQLHIEIITIIFNNIQSAFLNVLI